MTIERQERDTEGIGSLKLLSALDLPAAAKRAAGASNGVDEMASRLTAGARGSLANPSRLHGVRVEAMFRAVLVALGHFQLLTEEDEGQVYYEGARGPVKAPDYRIVDVEGSQLLVEVKAVRPSSQRLWHRIPENEFLGLKRYGELTGAPVAIAHYWSVANLWTLVDLERLQPSERHYRLDLSAALRFNQMSRFGDRMVGTVPPVELRLDVEEVKPRDASREATVLIRDAQILASGRTLHDSHERRIAFLLFRYGRWDIETLAEADSSGQITSFTLRASPPEDAAGLIARQGFAIAGHLSSMVSAVFNDVTLDDLGAVERLDHRFTPGEFGSLIPDDYFERSDRALRLWVLEVQAADAADGEG